MSTFNVHPEPEQILLTPLFSMSQQSQALLLPAHETDTETLAPASDQSHTSPNDQNGPDGGKEIHSAFNIRQASTICDPDELSAAQKEDAAYMQWSLEILVLLFAGAVFMSICLILWGYHGEVLPGWEDLRITLNTLISVLATILRVAIAFVAFEILAQLKWEWISNCVRPLYHVQLFDAASRGVLGSLRLLPTIIRHEPFAVVAVAIAVLSLGIGSFTQQSIQTYPCWKNASNVDDTTFIKIANTVSKGDMTDSWMAGGKPKIRMNLKMQMTIQDAVVNGVQDYNLAPLFECSSGNCTFPNNSRSKHDETEPYSHASLGVCSKCFNVTSLVIGPRWGLVENTNCTVFELPIGDQKRWDGHTVRGDSFIVHNDTDWPLMATITVDNFTWASGLVKQDFLDVASLAIANFTILTASQNGCNRAGKGNVLCPHDCDNEFTTRDDRTCLPRHKDSSLTFDPVAAACTLYPCLRYHIANVTNARLNESVVREVPLQPHGRGSFWDKFNRWADGGNSSLAAIQQPCFVDGVPYSDDNMPAYSELDPYAVTNLAKLLNTTVLPECLFEMPHDIWQSFRNEFRYALTAYCFSMRGGGVQCQVSRSKAEAGHPYRAIPSYPAHMAALYHNNNASIESINETFNALATRVTTAIRFDGRRLGKDEKAKVQGKLLETKVCVNFVWQWLIFPGALLVSSTVLLGAIVVKDTVAKKASIWKSSILPLLLKDRLGKQNTGLKGLEEVAQGLEIKLQREKMQQDFE